MLEAGAAAPSAPGLQAAGGATPEAAPAAAPEASIYRRLLYWRVKLLDPDRLLNWLEPRVRFIWTRGFALGAAAAVLLAALSAWAVRDELAMYLPRVQTWQTLLLVWLTVAAATTCHELAHGLTCKHYGGEVREAGFLLLFLTPCLYCNVSDAWLFPQKSARLWVTLAGTCCDLIICALALVVWRVTLPDTTVSYLGWVIFWVCGMRIFFNLNPLLKLDGYYILSDLTATPNLRQRSWEAVAARLRWLLWGAARPEPQPRAAFLLCFGVASWMFSLAFLALLLGMIYVWLRPSWGAWGASALPLAGTWLVAGLFRGVSGGEFRKMLRFRHKRVTILLLLGLGVGLFLLFGRWQERATGPFTLQPVTRGEVRAPLNAFLREVHAVEGQRVEAGDVIGVLEAPDLAAQLARMRADFAQAEAQHRLLALGPRTDPREDRIVMALRGRDEELAAARARADALREELEHLEELHRRQTLRAPVSGVVVTAHLPQKLGHYFGEGELICEVHDPTRLEAEVAVPEQDAARVRPGQRVVLKARAMPFRTYTGTVSKVAAAATPGDVQSSLTAYCEISDEPVGPRCGRPPRQ